MILRALLLAGAFFAGGGLQLAAQDHLAEVEYPAGFDEEARLYSSAIGALTRPVSTKSTRAQEFFDQGLQLMYAFSPLRAARSFRQAQKEDPECAICYWGEAWAWGPYLNGDMGPDDAPRAFEKITQALRLADRADEAERALIEAMAVRYAPEHDEALRERLDTAYAAEMAKVFERFPDDLDIGALYGEALMLLEPRRGRWDIEKPEVVRIHNVLEHVLAKDIAHPGACHLYVHATEPTEEPGKAEACADHLGASIPGASHIQHMPSHTYNRVGRWGDAVKANTAAWHTDLRAEEDLAWAIYPSHNLHMLLFAASMDGQGAVAIQAAKDYGKIVPSGSFYHAMTLVRFGRFDEVLELDDPPDGTIQRGFWDFSRGYAVLREKGLEEARPYLRKVRDGAKKGGEEERFRRHPARALLGIVGDILEGEILRAEGELDGAIKIFEAGAALEDELMYDEPEPLPFSIRHWLGFALLEAERYPEAARVYRLAIADHPRNGWSLKGLEQALRGMGREEEAERTRRAFEESWKRSDSWIKASIF